MRNLTTCLAIFCLLCSFFNTNAQTIIRGPYLQSVAPQSIHIKWRTNNITSSKVWYGTSLLNMTQSVVAAGVTTEHDVTLSGLAPNTKYYYAVGNAAGQMVGEDEAHYFKTSPVSSIEESINIWVLGDAGKRSYNQTRVRDAFFEFHGNEEIDMMLMLGDNAYSDGTDEEYQEAIFEDMYEDRLINATMFSCYGNHDSYSADSYTETGVYFDIFTFPKNGELGGVPSGNESYYSYDYGDIHVVSLNGHDEDVAVGSPQMQWLEADLAANTKNWLIAIFHFPVYDGRSDNASDGNTRERAMRENAAPILEAYGADLVLMGHSHSYQRSYLMKDHYGKSPTFDPNIHTVNMGDGQIDGDGAYQKDDDGKGTVYMVTGSAGAIVGDDLEHPVMYYSDNEYGSVRLQITHDELYSEFISRDGTVDDYFTIKKDLPPPTGQNYNCPNLNSYVGATCNDNNTATYDDVVSENCECVGIPFDCPITLANIGDACDDGDPNTYFDVLTDPGDCYCRGFPLGSVNTTSIAVASYNDDAEENEDGEVSLASTDLELIEDEDGDQVVGIRFDNIGIPLNSIVTSAYIQFTADETVNSNSCMLTIHGEDSGNAGSFTNATKNISLRPKTDASAIWSPTDWTSIGDAGFEERTADLKDIIQEVIAKPSYAYNNAIAFIITGDCKRVARSWDKGVSTAPVLVIEYAETCPDDDEDGICDDEEPCPGTNLIPGQACNDGNPETENDVITNNCICQGQVPGSGTPTTITVSINDGDNDAEERAAGYISLGGSDLELMEDQGFAQHVGIRFENVVLPAGATIESAHIQFTADESTEATPSNIQIYGIASDDPPMFVKQAYNVSNRTKTTAFANWSQEVAWEESARTSLQRTADLKNVIQEIVNRPGFQPGNAIAFVLQGQGKHKACSFDSNPLDAARLVVTYLSGNGGPTFGTSCARIISGTNDAEERSDGRMRLTSTDIELISDNENQVIGLRYVNMGIPANAMINNAKITFTVNESVNINNCNLVITGEKDTNSLPFENELYNVTSRPQTNAYVTWSPEDWTTVGASGAAQETMDLSPIIQEIITEPGFNANSAITIFFRGEGARTAESYEGDPALSPELCIEYEISSANGNTNVFPEGSAQNAIGEYRLGVFPNPVLDHVTVLFRKSDVDREVDVRILDVAGKLVFEKNKVTVAKGEEALTVEELNLNGGTFLIQLIDEHKVMSGRFVVVRM